MLAGTKHKHDADSGNKPHMLAGDGVALLSALTYGAYAVQVKHEARYLPRATYSPITSYYQWPLANGHLPHSVSGAERARDADAVALRSRRPGVLPHTLAEPRDRAPHRPRALPVADADRGADDHAQRPGKK